MQQLVARVQSRAFYAADLVVGRLLGASCPSCGVTGEVRIPKLGGLGSIFECSACGVLYRPTGLTNPSFARWYYSKAYADAGVATQPSLASNSQRLDDQISLEGKDRSAWVLPRLAGMPAEKRAVCVFGCSWGYEVELLRRAGVDAYGVELSQPRREFGIVNRGLEIYDGLESAARVRGNATGLVLSSHVLEHIPQLESTLDSIVAQLKPRVQVHITPNVEPSTTRTIVSSAVGREHPLGVTSRFWDKWAARRGLPLQFDFSVSETVAIVGC